MQGDTEAQTEKKKLKCGRRREEEEEEEGVLLCREHVSDWKGGSGDRGSSGHWESCGSVTAAELGQGW